MDLPRMFPGGVGASEDFEDLCVLQLTFHVHFAH